MCQMQDLYHHSYDIATITHSTEVMMDTPPLKMSWHVG